MPWRAIHVEEQRMQFVIRATSGSERLSALCREFGISRPTGYLWRRRYEQSRTLTEIGERSRRPHHSPTRTGVRQEQRVTALRKQTGWEVSRQLPAHVHSRSGSGAVLFASASDGAGSRRGGHSGRPSGSLRVPRARNSERASVNVLALYTEGRGATFKSTGRRIKEHCQV
jgi:hypothetical protein